MNSLRKFKFTVKFKKCYKRVYWEYSFDELKKKLLQDNLFFQTIEILDENDEVIFERDI